MSDEGKLTRTKQAWAKAGRFLTGRHSRPGDERLPPGQHLVRDWPVLDLGTQPDVPVARWSLRLFGDVEEQVSLDWAGFPRAAAAGQRVGHALRHDLVAVR